jgi:tetratricopeptide (TPR) repeat protein
MKVFNIKENWILSFLFLSVLITSILGQLPIDKNAQENADEQRLFRLAQKFQLADKHEQAIAILKKLYEDKPGTEKYYKELLQSLIQLSRTEDAIALIAKQRSFDPTNPRYDVDYGSVLYSTGQEKEAKKIWRDAVDNNNGNVAIFTLVANTMLTYGLYDDVIEVYKRGYGLYPKRTYFLQNIANIYRNRFQYKKAMEYYLEYLRNEPKNIYSITRQILSMEIDNKEVDEIANQLEEEAKRSKDIPEFQMLVAKFYQKYQKCDKALKVYETLENNTTQGKYLLDFGKTMQADSLYQLALQSYEIVINRYPNSPYLLTAYLGKARSNLELAQIKNDQQYSQHAIAVINLVRQKYHDHPEVAELSLIEGLIYKKFFFDIDKAIEIFKEISETYGKNPEIFERANLLLGECYLIRGDLSKAAVRLKKIQSNRRAAQALYLLAKIEFYQSDYTKSTEYLNNIIQLEGTGGTVTNDALDLQILISQAQTTPDILALYAEADLLLYQDKKSQAISKLQNALDKNPSGNLKAIILLKAARLSQDIGKANEALSFCNKLISDSTLTIYADEALFVMATIFEKDIGDLTHAHQLYDRLLVEFPESQFSNAARDRLNEIRNEKQDIIP